jgi:hypothetical protein
VVIIAECECVGVGVCGWVWVGGWVCGWGGWGRGGGQFLYWAVGEGLSAQACGSRQVCAAGAKGERRDRALAGGRGEEGWWGGGKRWINSSVVVHPHGVLGYLTDHK